MKKKDLLMALLVVIVWGVNFTVIKLGLNGVPPMLLAALRYTCVIPVIFFVKKPNIELKDMIFYGLAVGVGQFSCLFYSMQIGMPAGLSSIILQSAAFITPLLAFAFLKESVKPRQLGGLGIAGVGLYLIGKSVGDGGLFSIPLPALGFSLVAAFFWGISNIVLKAASNKAAKKGETIDMLGVVVWSSLVPPIPLLAMAFLFDSPAVVFNAFMNLNPISIFSVLYLGLGATVFGYGTWSILLGKYPASTIAPLSLMVPVTGLLSARIVLGEILSPLQWAGGMIILAGLLFSNLKFKQFEKTESSQ